MSLINVNELYFNKRIKSSPFYHYTSSEALVNIISKSSIRFTHCAFLNDTEEYLYIDEVIDDIVNENIDPEVSGFIKSIKKNLDHNYSGLILKPADGKWFHPAVGEYYVLSGTSEPDSLPMWNYYVKTGNYYGYSIKMDVRELYKMISPFLPAAGEFICGKVEYDKENQKKIVIDFTRQLLDDYNNRDIEERERIIEDLQDTFFEFIQRTRLFFKREGFKHEKELRVVVLTDTDNNNNRENFKVGYNTTKGLIKPYIEYTFTDKNLPIVHVKLSPTIEETIGIRGVGILLKNKHYEKVSVDKSELKLRF